MWVRVWVRMLDHPAYRLRFLDHPRATAFLQIVSDLHSRSWGRAGLWPEYNFGARLIPIDGNASHFHFHGAHVEGAHAVEVLQDAGANGVVVARLLLATACKKCGGEPHCERKALHARVLSNPGKQCIRQSYADGSLLGIMGRLFRRTLVKDPFREF